MTTSEWDALAGIPGVPADVDMQAASREIEEFIASMEKASIECDDLSLFDLLDREPDELNWQARGLCAQTDPEAFFPDKGGSTREAKRVCQRCPVRGECLEYALANDERFGVWGGLSERERRKLKKRGG